MIPKHEFVMIGLGENCALTLKDITIGDLIMTLYSLDGGKTWVSRAKDLQLFKDRKRQGEITSREMMKR